MQFSTRSTVCLFANSYIIVLFSNRPLRSCVLDRGQQAEEAEEDIHETEHDQSGLERGDRVQRGEAPAGNDPAGVRRDQWQPARKQRASRRGPRREEHFRGGTVPLERCLESEKCDGQVAPPSMFRQLFIVGSTFITLRSHRIVGPTFLTAPCKRIVVGPTFLQHSAIAS